MADSEHVEQLARGADHWNAWRQDNPDVQPQLDQADLRGLNLVAANLKHAQLREADLRDADLRNAWLMHADLGWLHPVPEGDSGARIVGADLRGANIRGIRAWRASFNHARLSEVHAERAELQDTNMRGADLHGIRARGLDARWGDFTGVNLTGADLWKADFGFANLSAATLDRSRLSRARLDGAVLVGASLREAVLAETHVYGVAAWDVELEGATQRSLVITKEPDPPITVDDIEVAHLVHLLMTNPKVRQVIDTMTSRVVLILGRFTDERKQVLDTVHAALAERGYVPVIFDFAGPSSRDLTETVRTLANLSRFIVADLSSPRSVAQELTAIVPNLLSVPVVPLLAASESEEYGMFEGLSRYPQVLEVVTYASATELVDSLDRVVVEPAENLVLQQRP